MSKWKWSEWFPWNGGIHPNLPWDTLVIIRMRDRGEEGPNYIQDFIWEHDGSSTDIMYYCYCYEMSSPDSDVVERLKAAQRELEAAQKAYEEEQERIKEWEPEGGEWYVASSGRVIADRSNGNCRIFGTERKTRSLAHEACKQMRIHNRALAYVHEHAPDWDGSDPRVVCFSSGNNYYSAEHDTGEIGVVRGPRWVMEKLARDLNRGRVKL